MGHILKTFDGGCGDNSGGERSGTENKAPQAPWTPQRVHGTQCVIWHGSLHTSERTQRTQGQGGGRLPCLHGNLHRRVDPPLQACGQDWTGSWTGQLDSAKQCLLHPNVPLDA